MVNVPVAFIAPVESPFITFIDSLSKFNILLDNERALLNLIYPKKLPLMVNFTGIL